MSYDTFFRWNILVQSLGKNAINQKSECVRLMYCVKISLMGLIISDSAQIESGIALVLHTHVPWWQCRGTEK